MKQSNTEQFSQKLYEAVNRSSQDVVIPPFEVLAKKIAEADSTESFEQFFEETQKSSPHAKSRRILTGVLCTAAAAAVLAMSGVWVSSIMNSRSFDASSQGVKYCEDSIMQESYCVNESTGDKCSAEVTKKSEEIMEEADQVGTVLPDTADLCSYECTEVIISGGKKLLISLDELTAVILDGDSDM